MSPLPDEVLAKLEALPVTPGCYLFKDREGKVVYIGKAKSLRSRVRSYFQAGSSDSRFFIPLLREIIGDLETKVVGSEKEAAILENALIKEHKPRFNVKLRDDKEFLSLKLDKTAEWPRLEVVRKPAEDGARYFGPYPSATSARRTLHLVNKHFQLRTCTDAELATRKRPCLQYQIKRCPAPCVYEVSRDDYGQQVDTVSLFLDGRHDELTRALEDRMKMAAQSLRFEIAGMLRDQLRAVSAVQESQRLVGEPGKNQDVIGVYREGDQVEIAVLFLRSGRIRDTCTFSLSKVQLPDEDVVGEFLRQFYEETAATGDALPEEILLPATPEGIDGTADWLSERAARKIALLCPQRGKKLALVALANENATHSFREKRRQEDDLVERLAEVQEKLRLPTLPRRIECVDISHLGGNDTVGAVVALTDGRPDKKRYRVFHVRTVEGGDDYAAMREVLGRRFRRGMAEKTGTRSNADDDPSKWDLPDLFVVDGGRGQLGVALAAAGDLGLSGLPIVGLAKERENVAGETVVDRVYLPGQKNGIPLRRESAALYFLAQARDEAHRFSNRARERLGKKARLGSELEGVAGIGKGSAKSLMTAFGSLKAILRASDSEIERVPGISPRAKAAIRELRLAQAAVVPSEAEPALSGEAPETADLRERSGKSGAIRRWASMKARGSANYPRSTRGGLWVLPPEAKTRMDAFARQFGAKIKQTRTERGMTQAELATAAEVGPNYVPRIERGEMTPSVDAAFRLSRALGLTLDDLCSPKAKRDPLGSATRQLAALSDTDLAGMKRTLDAVETVRKALREPTAAPATKPVAKKRAN